MTIRDKLIHTLRLAGRDWYHADEKRTVEEALADAILAEFDVTKNKCKHPVHILRQINWDIYDTRWEIYECDDCGARGIVP